MATSRREPHSDGRTNRAARNMSPVLKPAESGEQGFRRAKSVPNSPDRKLSPSPASTSSNPCRPSSSFNARTAASSRSGSPSSSVVHGKTLHSSSSMTIRGRAGDRSGGTSVWPAATHDPNSSKDMNRPGAKSPSVLQKSKLLSRLGAEKMTALSSFTKLRIQKGMSRALAGGRSQVGGTTPTPGATAKKKTGAVNSAPSIQRTKSVPARSIEAPPEVEEQEVELLMEFDEMESISTPSIEEHLQERLPDPVELKYVDVIAYVASQVDPSKPSYDQQEQENDEVMELVSEEQHQAKENEEGNADVGINIKVHVMKEAVDETELSEAVSETGLNGPANGTGSKGAVVEPELTVKEEAQAKEEKVMPPKKIVELVQGWRKDDGRSSEVKEDGRSRPVEERKSKVMALIGKFETAITGRECEEALAEQ